MIGRILGLGLAAVLAAGPAMAQDKVKVGVFPISSSLPYFVAIEQGFYKELGIEPETIKLMGGPPLGHPDRGHAGGGQRVRACPSWAMKRW